MGNGNREWGTEKGEQGMRTGNEEQGIQIRMGMWIRNGNMKLMGMGNKNGKWRIEMGNGNREWEPGMENQEWGTGNGKWEWGIGNRNWNRNRNGNRNREWESGMGTGNGNRE